MQYLKLKLQQRLPCYLGKKGRKRMRNAGLVPVNWCWQNGTSVSAMINEVTFKKFFKETHYNHNAIIELESDFGKANGILRDLSYFPLQKKLQHVEFHELKANQKVTVSVPLLLVGKSAGAEEGALTELVLHELEIECLPHKIPENIQVDISHLNVGDSIHVNELMLDADITILSDGDGTIATCHIPQEEVVAPAATEAVEAAVASEVAADAQEEASKPAETEKKQA